MLSLQQMLMAIITQGMTVFVFLFVFVLVCVFVFVCEVATGADETWLVLIRQLVLRVC